MDAKHFISSRRTVRKKGGGDSETAKLVIRNRIENMGEIKREAAGASRGKGAVNLELVLDFFFRFFFSFFGPMTRYKRKYWTPARFRIAAKQQLQKPKQPHGV